MKTYKQLIYPDQLLSHSALGTTWKNSKYIDRIKKPDGTYRYIYNDAKSSISSGDFKSSISSGDAKSQVTKQISKEIQSDVTKKATQKAIENIDKKEAYNIGMDMIEKMIRGSDEESEQRRKKAAEEERKREIEKKQKEAKKKARFDRLIKILQKTTNILGYLI